MLQQNERSQNGYRNIETRKDMLHFFHKCKVKVLCLWVMVSLPFGSAQHLPLPYLGFHLQSPWPI